jgi:hypothetical protein
MTRVDRARVPAPCTLESGVAGAALADAEKLYRRPEMSRQLLEPFLERFIS